jgi:glycosyltransferase involved in cell wall biosynthesis
MKRIAYIQYTNPALYPPLEHSSRILADRGWEVLLLGASTREARGFAFEPHENIHVRNLGFRPRGWLQKPFYLLYALWVLGWLLVWRPAWIYVSDPLACPAGLLAGWILGLRLIYHEHDSPTVTDQRSTFMKIVLWSRERMARRAAQCILPNAERAKSFAHETGAASPVLCVWNCPARHEVLPQPRLTTNGSEIWVHYHGNIGPPLLPTTVLSALTRLPERVKLCVIGYETAVGYVVRLQEAAKQFEVAHRVQFMGPLPRAKMLERCRRSHVGLALMPMRNPNCNEQAMAGASNKAFEYLACGLAMLVSDLPEWRAMYVDTGVGLACDPDDPASIATALAWFLDHPDQMHAMGECGRRRILEEWNYEAQFTPVLNRLGGREDNSFSLSVC